MVESLEQTLRHFIGWGYLWGYIWGGLAGAACYHMYRISSSRLGLWTLRIFSYAFFLVIGAFALAIVVGLVTE